MAMGQNPYYNPIYAQAAENIASAITGDPERAGAIAYDRARARHESLRGDRQQIENDALTTGLEEAYAAAGNTPESFSGAMPRLLPAMVRAGITDPSKFINPAWAIASAMHSGASPAEGLARAVYVSEGKAVPLDLALTPGRADDIRAQEYNKDTNVARINNAGRIDAARIAADQRATAAAQKNGGAAGTTKTAGGRALAPVKLSNKDLGAMVEGALKRIPGAVGSDGNINPALRAALPADRYVAAQMAGEEEYQTTRSRARAAEAFYNALQLPADLAFAETYDPRGLFNKQQNVFLQGGKPYAFGPMAADMAEGAAVDIPAAPAAAPAAQAPMPAGGMVKMIDPETGEKFSLPPEDVEAALADGMALR